MAIKCKECGEVENDPRPTEQMIERQLCFICNCWTNDLNKLTDERTVIINHRFYRIGTEGPEVPSYLRGFGGHRFRIKFHDGREVQTVSLWCGGDVPPHFRERIPDNAEFIQ